MVRSDKRFWVCLILLILNLGFIWGNSLLPVEVSRNLSSWVFRIFRSMAEGMPNGASVEEGSLRKFAHFLEFTCLGISLSWFVRMIRHKTWQYYAIPLWAGLAAACIDETIQGFVPGRGPQIRDVGIDFAGVLLGILLFCLIRQCIRMKRRKTNEKNDRDPDCADDCGCVC